MSWRICKVREVYDYGFRIYNSQIAKFLSVDPLTKSYPWYTPYQFAGNDVIRCIDLDGLEPWDVNNKWNTSYIKEFGAYSAKMQKEYYDRPELSRFTCEDLQLALVIDFAKENNLPFKFQTLGIIKFRNAEKVLNLFGIEDDLTFYGYKESSFDANSDEYNDFSKFKNAVLSASGAGDLTSPKNSEPILWTSAQSGDFIGLLRGRTFASHIQPISKVSIDNYLDLDFNIEKLSLFGYDGNTSTEGREKPSASPSSGNNYIGEPLRKWSYMPYLKLYFRNGKITTGSYSKDEQPEIYRFNFLQWNEN